MVPGSSKHIRHRGQDSVDSTFSMKMGLNFVHISSKNLWLGVALCSRKDFVQVRGTAGCTESPQALTTFGTKIKQPATKACERSCKIILRFVMEW